MNLSQRTNWHNQPNKLTILLDSLRKSGRTILDLTISNPTECGFKYPENEILTTLSNPLSLHYQPNPRGLLSARESVCGYYQQKDIIVDPSKIFLTSSTSEAYSVLFKLLCDAGDSVLVPKPSYPLFDYLAQLNDVRLKYYNLYYDDKWYFDVDSFNDLMIENNGKIKAIVLVNPHNPTGMFIKKNDYKLIKDFVHKHKLALIVDEVFIDYSFEDDENRITSTAGETEILNFTLNSISKMIGLPQMKLGWIILNGQQSIVNETVGRLEIISDTFLSVNTPVQVALPMLLIHGKQVQKQIRERIKTNYTALQNLTVSYGSLSYTPCPLLNSEGGWYGIIHVPHTKSDEEWALQLLENKNIYVHPGYLFDFDEDGYLVVSLLVEKNLFISSVKEIIDYIVNI